MLGPAHRTLTGNPPPHSSRYAAANRSRYSGEVLTALPDCHTRGGPGRIC